MPWQELEDSAGYDNKHELAPFFEPRNVAVVGSFREGTFGGYVVVKNLLNAGFTGNIYLVNPSYKEVLNMKVYPSIRDVPEKIDLVLIMIGCKSVPQVMRECAQKGVPAVVVIADGFAERDEEGARLQKEIVEIARQAGMRIIGPNTAGIANATNGLNPCPYEAGYSEIKKGPVAICSQTGVTNPQAFPYPDLQYGVSKICDFGNKCDVDECDMLEYLGSDPATKVISMYLESIKDGRRFLEVSKRVASKKPLLILKCGRTSEGARASASHTGSLAVDDRVFNAACSHAGIIRLEKLSDLFELPKVFACQPPPRGNRLGIVSFTGGVGVLATDEAAKYGLSVTTLAPKTAEVLNVLFPGMGKIPVDIGPLVAYVGDFMSVYPQILNAVMADDNIDCLFNVIWADPTGATLKGYVQTYTEMKRNYQKPVVTWIYSPSLVETAKLTQHLENLGFPVYTELETAIKALSAVCRYTMIKEG